MEINELEKFGIPQEFISLFKRENISDLYPPQADAIKNGVLSSERNFVLSFPTASGKTLLASLAALNSLSKKRGKVVYMVPLVALASEKYAYYKNLLSGFKVSITAGDLDSSEPWLESCDFIIATTEKLDSLIRHGISWLKQISLIIIDEIHMLNDYKRGPTLEVLITQLRRLSPSTRILALSATINNARELSSWLDAELVTSDFRPVKLYEGISLDATIQFEDKEGYILKDELDPESAIAEQTMRIKKQVLFFVSSRRNAEALSERLGKVISKFINPEDKKSLAKLEEEALSALETPTHQCRRLAKCIREGTAFHHAGLVAKQKRLVEEGFRSGPIKAIVATPTLALGVNLPCFRVVIRDIKRYYPGLGSEYIPTMEYKQFVGRAGRPQFDKFGESILIAKTEREARILTERYIKGQSEDIDSKLAQESVLRMHILSLISSDLCGSTDELLDFFNLTLFGFQYGDTGLLKEKIDLSLEKLNKWGFICQEKTFLKATALGKKISRLYLDPRTAYDFIVALNTIQEKNNFSNLGLLQIISSAEEISPPLRLSEEEEWKIGEFISREREQFVNSPLSRWDDGFEEFLSSVKLALMFESWTQEESEEFILDNFRVTPGELYSKREILDWLVYSIMELAEVLKMKETKVKIKKLRTQLYYGVKEELLDLVMLKDIGRKRARRLFNAGFKNITSLRQATDKQLAEILGPSLGMSVRKEILLSAKR